MSPRCLPGVQSGDQWRDGRVLPYRGDVFATIYPDVWKLNDIDDDGYADKREVFSRVRGTCRV